MEGIQLKKLFIGFDLDGVILNRISTFGDIAQGIAPFPSNWLYEQTFDQLIENGTITRELYNRVLQVMYNDLFKGILHLHPYKSAITYLEKIRDDDHICLGVTNLRDKALLMVDHIRERHFSWMEIVSVRSIDKTIGTLGMDVFVDNSPEKLRLLNHIPHRILHSYAYHTEDDKKGFIDAPSWEEIYQSIKKIANN